MQIWKEQNRSPLSQNAEIATSFPKVQINWTLFLTSLMCSAFIDLLPLTTMVLRVIFTKFNIIMHYLEAFMVLNICVVYLTSNVSSNSVSYLNFYYLIVIFPSWGHSRSSLNLESLTVEVYSTYLLLIYSKYTVVWSKLVTALLGPAVTEV